MLIKLADFKEHRECLRSLNVSGETTNHENVVIVKKEVFDMADKFDEMQEMQTKQSLDIARNNALMAQLVQHLHLTIDKSGDLDASFITSTSEKTPVDVSQNIAKTGSETEKLEQEIYDAQMKVQQLQQKYLADTGKMY